MSELNPKDAAASAPSRQPATSPGATGIFGALVPEPPAGAASSYEVPFGGTSSGQVPVAAFSGQNRAPAQASPTVPFPPALPPRPPAAPLIVHEVTFQAQETDGPDAADPLHRLMQSQPAVPHEPSRPQPATGGFTQLLSALQLPPAEPLPVPYAGSQPASRIAAQPAFQPAPLAVPHPQPAPRPVPQPALKLSPYELVLNESERQQAQGGEAAREMSPSVGASAVPANFIPAGSGAAALGSSPAEQRPSSLRPPPDAEDDLSFTQLFEALASSPPPAAAPSPAWGAAAQHAPNISAEPPASSPPQMPAPAGRSGPSVTAIPQPAPVMADVPASFTQLFAALGNGPRPESNQSTDYPPIVPTSHPAQGSVRSFQADAFQGAANRAQGAGWSASGPAPGPAAGSVSGTALGFASGSPLAASPNPVRTGAPADLSSLTQLLQALESGPGMGPRYEPAPPAAAPLRTEPLRTEPARGQAMRGEMGSGATVAFTPPESVQRLTAQPPRVPTGPGDFTRVLQASALRESGMGSQAAAAAHPAGPPVPSHPPAPAAGAALPPWAAPPAPYLTSLPHLAHGGHGGVSLGPVPGFPAHGAGPFSMPPPGTPLHPPQQTVAPPRAGLPLLPLILMAIIVILVGVLVALLLRH